MHDFVKVAKQVKSRMEELRAKEEAKISMKEEAAKRRATDPLGELEAELKRIINDAFVLCARIDKVRKLTNDIEITRKDPHGEDSERSE